VSNNNPPQLETVHLLTYHDTTRNKWASLYLSGEELEHLLDLRFITLDERGHYTGALSFDFLRDELSHLTLRR